MTLRLTPWQYRAVLEEQADIWSRAKYGLSFRGRMERLVQLASVFSL